MKITIIGSGYVGLVTGTCIAERGNRVVCIDNNTGLINNLNKGIIPIYEPGLEPMILKNVKRGDLFFSTDLKKGLQETELVFIAVGTPMGEDGSADLTAVLKVAQQIGENMDHELIIVNKSTVPVGTADKVSEVVSKALASRDKNIPFDVVSNPEFLKEGAAIQDFMKPDRIVVGASNERSFAKMRQLYAPFLRNHNRLIEMDVRSAEMTKYAANAMLATKISFINEIANICELVGADVNKVRLGIGSDSRIGYDFIYPGSGYGGSCFPKDIKALRKMASDAGYEAQILTSVERVNDFQKTVIADKVIKRFGKDLNGYTFALWGLAFKPETDDMREAPSIYTVKKLLRHGAKIQAYDPKAGETARKFYFKGEKGVTYADTKYGVLEGADALILLTEWKEFNAPDFHYIIEKLKNPVIFDGRNQYSDFNLKELGIEYHQVGKKTI